MKTVFLATTALEEFWDVSQPTLFLSESCCRYVRRSFYEKLRYEIFPCLWKDRHAFHDAYNYTNSLYETLLPALGKAMNEIHSETHGVRYWRILLGPWLYQYICACYDRYWHLREALRLYPGLRTTVMAEESFITPGDSSHFIQLSEGDPYNLQLCSQILSILGKQFPARDYYYPEPGLLKNSPVGFQGNIKKLAKSCINSIGELRELPSVVLVNPYFGYIEQLILLLKSRGRVQILHKEKINMPEQRNNGELRSRLGEQLNGRDEFGMLMARMIPSGLPKCFIENYKKLALQARIQFPVSPKIIGSAVLWYNSEDFKYWAANASETGVKLVGIQHGGNYGTAAYIAVEAHELAITDYYCSWGWDSSASKGKIIPLPGSKLTGRKRLGANNAKNGILFTVTAQRRYLFRFQNLHSGENSEYLRWQFRFVSSLPRECRENINIRFRSDDFGQDLMERWKDAGYGGNCIDNWQETFYEKLKKCRLFVCGDLSTTYAEALAVDKPTILFWDPRIFTIRAEAEPCFRELAEAGILYDTPEAAASAAGAAYEDVEAWWGVPERQKARKRFCDKFAWTSPNALSKWSYCLMDLCEGIPEETNVLQ